jgi:hypothetical protein
VDLQARWSEDDVRAFMVAFGSALRRHVRDLESRRKVVEEALAEAERAKGRKFDE